LETNYLRMYWTDLHQTFPHGVHLATTKTLLCSFPENTLTINEGQKRALCYRVLFNHIRQMAPTVDTDANRLVSAGEAAHPAGSRWT